MQRFRLPDKITVMLDSGAFSAWRMDIKIDLDAYISFVKRFDDLIYRYVNLDVIPGQPNKTPTPTEVADSASEGLENLRYMIANGLKPMPVYHQGERLAVLHELMKEHDYVGIAPHTSKEVSQMWLDAVFNYINRAGAKIQTHGFGVTSVDLMHRYPWTSCDSTSWTKHAGYGSVLIPCPAEDGGCNYLVSPKVISFSDRIPSNRHYLAYMGASKEYLDAYVAKCNTTPELLMKNGEERMRLNAEFYFEVARRCGIKLFLACDLSTFKVLNRTASRHRLVSYYSIKGVSREAFAKAVYNQNGRVNVPKH